MFKIEELIPRKSRDQLVPFGAGLDRNQLVINLRELADRLEQGNVHLIQVLSADNITVDDYAAKGLYLEYLENYKDAAQKEAPQS